MKTALEIAAAIRNSEKTVTETIQEHIALIEKANPTLNAVVETNYDAALAEAQNKDEALQNLTQQERKFLPPLFGVPFTCKEMISNAGMKSTMGSFHRKDQVMSLDATVVRRMKDAGALLLATTNVPEVGFWYECDNVLYGPTKNPYDHTRTSGGSSGGEGAIIGSGASPFGIGSDLGGSVRMPAAFCGVFGHKPSDRVVPLTGHYPLYPDNSEEMIGHKYPFTVIGPLARSAADLEVIFRLMVGPDEIDRNLKEDFSLQPVWTSFEDLKVYSLPSPVIHATTETEKDLSRTIELATRYLKEIGARAMPLPPRTFLRAAELWAARAWTIDGKVFSDYLADDNPLNYPVEIFRLLMGKRKYTLPSLLTGIVDRHMSDRSDLQSNLQALSELKKDLTDKLGKNGVLLMPVHPRKAPELNSTYLRPFDFAYTGIFNALGFPATSVPMGLSKEGLPLSLQVIASEDQDHLCLSVARALEKGFGGWKPPRGTEISENS